jgi:hypothetical protein
MLEEAVQVCRAMFTGDDVSFSGTYYRLNHARNLPRPVQAGGPKIMIGVLHRHCAEVGRDPAEVGADEVIFSFPFADTAGITAVGEAFGLGGQ